ncbi:hypothetical protein MTR_2g437620 [Medicago truncatula]|uniref:Uncharacterized protein n=1 Tax=Medicago truncatula TaxID=3880 RepID=A0A072V5Q0_MEDTR|nr:hypothetical protein MTR_2g437620 [Medicago truncatula]
MRFQKENTYLHPPPQLHPSNQKNPSSSQSVELPRKVGNLNHKKHLKQCKTMSLSKGKGKTHAVPDEFDLRSIENANRKQQSIYKNEDTIIKEVVAKSSKRMDSGHGFKCHSFGMCFPGFGKVKPIKTRKIETKVDYSMNVMSSTFSISFENFDINAQGRIVRENNNEDNSISSYFELPSTAL